jgi:hypothetical protein
MNGIILPKTEELPFKKFAQKVLLWYKLKPYRMKDHQLNRLYRCAQRTKGGSFPFDAALLSNNGETKKRCPEARFAGGMKRKRIKSTAQHILMENLGQSQILDTPEFNGLAEGF